MYNPKLSKFLESYGIIIVVLVMAFVIALSRPDVFLTPQNLTNILKQNATLALLALGMFVVIVTAGIDLSVGSTMALGMVCLAVASKMGLPWPVVILIGPLVGIAVGLVNGIGLTWLKLPHPFIMTLGTLNIARGLTYLATNGAPVSGLQPEVRYIGQAYYDLGIFAPPAGIPASLLLVAVCAVGLWFFLEKTNVGRHIYAIGGNPQAARVSGVNVDRVLVLVYVISGFFAGLGGLLLAGRTDSGFPNAGIGLELDAIAAVIIGGASFFGGRGTVIGVLAGVLIMGLLRNGLNINNVSPFWQMVLIGAVIIFAVWIDVVRRRASVRR
ncbi:MULTISPECIES: ABC transporter permease [unclassified Devosia]|uniref:ABC transporter permease n=1 Tax=unclassified Devosia TaxID=196773 RepID=UPI00145E782F|nr:MULTISPECIES: ABC transporter permease [unclassified Devosia]MBJ6985843.1 ABC transporter permease [Devosia sp. MC521]MBJ7577939.1 ABC transporter permease [Devosia sp. MC532]MBK1793267.1 ABC transporter permease [Devosia sp. WQ 349K1]QMW61220.1 ABC transporter permease [Devosia sp. MC521]